MVDFIEYRQRIKKFKTEYFLQFKKIFTTMIWLRFYSYQFHKISTGKHV